jgi:hypothetical protein
MKLEPKKFLRALFLSAILPLAIAAFAHPPGESLAPFRIGETLNYQVQWSAFSSAAAVQLTVPERRELFGWRTWHFRASARTLSPLRSFVTVNDQFDSYADAATLESRQYEMYLDEMGQRQTEVLRLVPVGQSRRGNGTGVAVLPGTLDPLAALYALRGVDWQQQRDFRAPLYDGRDVYEMLARLQVPNETVAVTAGNFSATRISIELFERGKQVPESTFSLWLARDATHTPILIEAELPMGNVRAELTSASR